MGLFATELNRGDFAVKLKPGHKRSSEEVVADPREQIEQCFKRRQRRCRKTLKVAAFCVSLHRLAEFAKATT
jgi:hypothetical protein